jgi:hypothetical protein
MERALRIYVMSDAADPTALALSRLLQDRFPREYTATRESRSINLKSVPHGHDNLWSFIMLPDTPMVSRSPFSPRSLTARRRSPNGGL